MTDFAIIKYSEEKHEKATKEEVRSVFSRFKTFFEDIFGIYYKIKSVFREIRFFYQRLFYGWSHDEVYCLDTSLYRWLLPRLRHLSKVNNGWNSDKYKTFEDWQLELASQVQLLQSIVDAIEHGEYTFDNYSRFNPKLKAEKRMDKNATEYYKAVENFNKWLGENLSDLWW